MGVWSASRRQGRGRVEEGGRSLAKRKGGHLILRR